MNVPRRRDSMWKHHHPKYLCRAYLPFNSCVHHRKPRRILRKLTSLTMRSRSFPRFQMVLLLLIRSSTGRKPSCAKKDSTWPRFSYFLTWNSRSLTQNAKMRSTISTHFPSSKTSHLSLARKKYGPRPIPSLRKTSS